MVDLCAERVDVGDRYEVILPCLLWKGHDRRHEEDVADAIQRWADRAERAESAIRRAVAEVDRYEHGMAHDILRRALGDAPEPASPSDAPEGTIR